MVILDLPFIGGRQKVETWEEQRCASPRKERKKCRQSIRNCIQFILPDPLSEAPRDPNLVHLACDLENECQRISDVRATRLLLAVAEEPQDSCNHRGTRRTSVILHRLIPLMWPVPWEAPSDQARWRIH